VFSINTDKRLRIVFKLLQSFMPEQTINFLYSSSRAINAILWFLDKHSGTLSKLKLVKLVFFADKKHLRRYGRPIVGGRYYAMPHGPVSSELLTYINSMASPEAFPFALLGNDLSAKIPPDLGILSQSDIEILENVNNEYGHFHPLSLRNYTHLLPEWILNFGKKKEGFNRHPIPYEDFFDEKTDDVMLEIIRDEQEAWAELD